MAVMQPVGHGPVIVENMEFHVGENVGVGAGKNSLGVRPNVDSGVFGRGKGVIDASNHCTEVEGEGGVVKVDDHGHDGPANKGSRMVIVEGKNGGGTVWKRAGEWGGEGIPVSAGVPSRWQGFMGVGQGNKVEQDGV